MVTLYLTSSQGGTGKTTLCAGLGKHLQKAGKKVGFLKLVAAGDRKGVDNDALFMKHIFALPETVESICPLINSQNNLAEGVKQAHAQVAPGKDVVIVEGLPLDASYGVVAALDARVIIVEGYASERVLPDYKKFGAHLLGVVLNKVPKSKVGCAQSQTSNELSPAGINLLGVLPEDRALIAPTIGELTELVRGKILSGAEKSAELIENFMLGAMTIDPGPLYYSRKSDKAVLVRSERPDMQLAALETPTRCLILSGNTPPIPAVANRAQVKKIPIIMAGGDIKTLVTTIESAFSQAKFSQEKKLPRLAELIEKGFNFKIAYQGLGLAG